ncbi:hypothetical protein [Salinigranum sp.]|uniref:hypothetical protein n=1 Tax=Salinigranum sp. TaxID=1966351 RepID=UPI0035686AC9
MTRRRRSDSDSDPDLGDTDPDDDRSLDDLVAALASTLQETEEVPVTPSASVWLGEAHAVAADLTRGTVDERVIHERVGHVHRLLTNAGDLDNDVAARRVDDAVALATTILARTDDADADAEDEREHDEGSGRAP